MSRINKSACLAGRAHGTTAELRGYAEIWVGGNSNTGDTIMWLVPCDASKDWKGKAMRSTGRNIAVHMKNFADMVASGECRMEVLNEKAYRALESVAT